MKLTSFKNSPALTLIALLLILLVLGFATYSIVKRTQYAKSDVSTQLFSGKPEDYTSLDGAQITLTTYAGKNIYINNWASWSPLSQQELIDLNEVAGEYKDKNIVFLALNRKETKDMAERYMASLPPLPNLTFVIDTNDVFYGNIGGYAMPETVIFDATGKTAYHDRTPLSKEQMKTRIDAVLVPH
jgi:thiol-disulfide isomerase/thioredoxin